MNLKIIEIDLSNSEKFVTERGSFVESNPYSENLFKINPINSGVFSSLARVIARTKSNCGCLYLKKTDEENQEEKLYFSSNQFPNSKENKIFNERTEEIINSLRELLNFQENGNDLEDLKADFIKIFFKNMINLNLSLSQKTNIQSKMVTGDDQEKKVASIIAERVLKKNYNWTVEKFEELKNEISKYTESKPIRVPKSRTFRKSVFLLSCYLEDIKNLLSLSEEYHLEQENTPSEKSTDSSSDFDSADKMEIDNPDLEDEKKSSNLEKENKLTIKKLLKSSNFLSKPFSLKEKSENNEDKDEYSNKKFHCECRIFEHILKESSNGEMNRDSWKVFRESFKEKRISISKPCCFYCHFFLISVEISTSKKYRKILSNKENPEIGKFLKYEDKSGVSLITHCLGNSGRVFSWISPSSISSTDDSDEFIKSVRDVFNSLSKMFEFKTGVLDFVNENSEALECQIEYQTPEGHVGYGW